MNNNVICKFSKNTTKTQEVMRSIMNDIVPDLKFTTESQYDYSNLQLPTLDFTMQLTQMNDTNHITYNFEREKNKDKKVCFVEFWSLRYGI